MKKLCALFLLALAIVLSGVCVCEQPLSVEEELKLYRANRDRIFEFLIDDMGFNYATACGIIANMHVESRFNPEALGDYGTSFGICQWHNKRYTLLVEWSEQNDLDYRELETQLQFMKYELEGKYLFVYEHLLLTADTTRGAYSAGNYWCIYYEKPKNKYVSGDRRGEIARTIYWYELESLKIEE